MWSFKLNSDTNLSIVLVQLQRKNEAQAIKRKKKKRGLPFASQGATSLHLPSTPASWAIRSLQAMNATP